MPYDTQLVAHLLNQLSSLEYNLHTTHESMPDLPPANYWGPALLFIQHLKWWSFDTSMVTIVVRELN